MYRLNDDYIGKWVYIELLTEYHNDQIW